MDVEARILSVRRTLREDSVLGEYKPDAIDLALQEDSSLEQLPSRTTIYRVLERHGALDGTHRQRRPAPPKGWHLPALTQGQAGEEDGEQQARLGQRPRYARIPVLLLLGQVRTGKTKTWEKNKSRRSTAYIAPCTSEPFYEPTGCIAGASRSYYPIYWH
jgi:hypothetical protein